MNPSPNAPACHYCTRNGQAIAAVEVVHDGRGCLWVCAGHAKWRRGTSTMGGHKHCPEGHADGTGPLNFRA